MSGVCCQSVKRDGTLCVVLPFLLFSLFAVSPFRLFAEGGWLRVSYDPSAATLRSVCVTSTGAFIAVGDNGTIQRAVTPYDTLLPVRGSRFYSTLRDVKWHSLLGLVAVGDDDLMLSSEDDGITWYRFTAPSDSLSCIDINSQGRMVVGGAHGLWRNDGNAAFPIWVRITSLENITAVHCVSDAIWMIGTRDGKLWRTSDAFAHVDTVLTAPRGYPTAFTQRGDSLYVCMASSIGLSSDKGISFDIKQCASGGDVIRGISAYSKDARVAIAVDGSAGGGGMSFDGGLNFWLSSLSNPALQDIVFSDSMCLAVCTDGAYMLVHANRLRNRDSVQRNLGRPVLRSEHQSWLRVVGSREHVIGVVNFGESTVEESLDSGRTWNITWVDTGTFKSKQDFIEPFDMIELMDGSVLLVTDTVVNISPDNGSSRAAILRKGKADSVWNKVLSTKKDTNIYSALAFPPSNVLALSSEAVWLSTDNGITWRKHSLDINYNTVSVGHARGVLLAVADSSTYASYDLGATWQYRARRPGTSPDIVGLDDGRFVISDYSRPAAWTAHGCLVWVSQDTGRTWRQTLVDTSERQAYFASKIAASQTGGDLVICGSYDLAYTSTNYGESWTKHNIPTQRQIGFIHPQVLPDRWVRVAGFNNHIWEYQLTGTVGVSEDALTPISSLELNISIAPNPATSVVHITSDQHISKIDILDLNGHVLTTYIEPATNTSAGSASSAFINVQQLNVGVYYARVRTDSGITVTRFIKSN